MIEREVLIVGGGPGGAAAAWQLNRLGIECLVLDRENFPRDKLCAGWITPQVVADIDLDPTEYPHRFLTFQTLKTTLFGIEFSLRSPQHSVRRFEFDDWLLARSGAEIRQHTVREVERVREGYVIDGKYHCRYLIGAGGTRCPVFRTLFRSNAPRNKRLQAVALELEFPCNWRDENCHLWFLTDGLPGYSWYVPKSNGYLNIGVGGLADQLNQRGDDIRRHWQRLVERLIARKLIDGSAGKPHGYSYFLSGSQPRPRLEDAFVVGDAAGLATRDLCEGIGPAVRSGLFVARVIGGADARELTSDDAYTTRKAMIRRGLEWRYRLGASTAQPLHGRSLQKESSAM